MARHSWPGTISSCSTPSASGTFSSYALPSLNAGLRWDTSRLNVDGSLWVISTSSPLITQAAAIANNFVLAGSGGTPNWNYYLLTATNVTQPASQWTRIATNTFGPTGGFSYTNPINPAMSQLFLQIQVQ